MPARIHFTYYLDVISSWCFYAEPMIAELRAQYESELDYEWKVTLIAPPGVPASKAQEEWFYQRSGLMVRWPTMLNADWFDPDLEEYLAPNLVAEAAKDLGFHDDRVRLAIARAGMVDGAKIGQVDVCIASAAAAVDLDAEALREAVASPAVEERCRASTAEFTALQIDQRPGFLLQSDIGDRAVFSGLIQKAPLVATIDAMIADSKAYQSHRAHFGDPPGE